MPAEDDAFSPLSLLDPVPIPRVHVDGVARAIGFAFSQGEVGRLFDEIVEQMPIAASEWQADQFERDIFLGHFVARCFPVVVGGRAREINRTALTRILRSPPADRSVVLFRQAIFRELEASKHLHGAAETFYLKLTHLRDLLAHTGAGLRVDPLQRRLDVMRTIVELVGIGIASLQHAKSGLSVLGQWARAMAETSSFKRMADLVAYEDDAATIRVTLRLGFDGRVRALTVDDIVPNDTNAFHQTRTARLASRFGMLARGYSFSDNELLERIVDEVFSGIEPGLVHLFPLVADLEFYLAGMSFRDGAVRAGLEVSLPIFRDRDDADAAHGMSVTKLFNPLLLAERGQTTPCELATHTDASLIIVTGPNSGGKTRLLQAIAFTQLLGQVGCFVPAARATLSFTRGLFLSLIEHAEADQKEGRLGTELHRIRRLFERVRPNSLVLLDELCSGTNPTEGEEIFRLVVNLLGELDLTTFVTTHFLAFAARLSSTNPELEFLQVELDADERPTYQFVRGVAETSLAHRTAERLGVTEEALRSVLAKRAPEDAPSDPGYSMTPVAASQSSRA